MVVLCVYKGDMKAFVVKDFCQLQHGVYVALSWVGDTNCMGFLCKSQGTHFLSLFLRPNPVSGRENGKDIFLGKRISFIYRAQRGKRFALTHQPSEIIYWKSNKSYAHADVLFSFPFFFYFYFYYIYIYIFKLRRKTMVNYASNFLLS